MLDEFAHHPVLLSPADADSKVLEELGAAGSVGDFGVELDA